jgi:hypothetical protein
VRDSHKAFQERVQRFAEDLACARVSLSVAASNVRAVESQLAGLRSCNVVAEQMFRRFEHAFEELMREGPDGLAKLEGVLNLDGGIGINEFLERIDKKP